MFIPVFSFTAFSTMADVIVILYLLLIPALSMILGGAASGSPYAGVGLSREMVTVIACELPLVLVLLAVAKTVGNATGSGLVFSMSEIIRYQLANGSLITHVSMIPADRLPADHPRRDRQPPLRHGRGRDGDLRRPARRVQRRAACGV